MSPFIPHHEKNVSLRLLSRLAVAMDRINGYFLLVLATIAFIWATAKSLRRPRGGYRQIRGQFVGRASKRSRLDEDNARTRSPIDILYPSDAAVADTEVDIVAVHGLGSKVDWSWVWKDEFRNVNWLGDRDMLPSIVPKARIMVYNYDSRWHKDAPRTRLELCGEDLMRTMHNQYRQENIRRPIIFIGHSLGGNVIINGLLYANSEPEWEYLPNMTVGLIFLGSPFRGSKSQYLIDLAARILTPAGSHRGIIKELDYDNEILRSTLNRFCRLRNRLSISVSCFFEQYASDYGKRAGISGIKSMIVDEASASIPGLTNIALQTDHFKINKFSGPEDRSYKLVSTEIHQMFINARDTIQNRETPKTIVTDRTYILNEYPNCSVVLNDLFLTDPLEDKNALKRKKGARAEGTCEWIMGTETITQWLQGGALIAEERVMPNLLWLFARPGMGKSTMSIFLAEELSNIFASTPSRTVSYFFCDSNFVERKKANSILRGIILQLVQQHPSLMMTYLLPKYNGRGSRLFDSFDALWALFLAMGQDKATGEKYCIIDALDECDRESQEMLLKQMRQTFRHSNAETYSNIHILITSRPYSDISRHFRSTPFVHKDLASFSEVKRDVDLFIREKVDHLSAMNGYTKSIEQQAIRVLSEKSEGTFLWVGLACTELEQIPSKNAVKFLQQLPNELHFLYRNLISMAIDANKSDADVIKRILTFVAVAIRPMTILELSGACSLHEDEEKEERLQFMQDDIALCRLLVVIDGEKVLLLHKSVQDFLQSSHGLSMSRLEMHAALAYRCLDQLLLDFRGDQNAALTSEGKSFSAYADYNWTSHAQMAMLEFKVQDSHLEFFSLDSDCRLHWLRRRFTPHIGPRFSILHVAAYFGISTLVDYTFSATDFSQFDDSNYLNERTESPLEAAAERGNLETIQRLLAYGNKNMKLGRRVLSNALRSRYRNTEMMRLFLDYFGNHIIDEQLLISAVSNNGDVFDLLITRIPDGAIITDKVVAKAAERNMGNLTLLFDRHGRYVPITEKVVQGAVKNNQNGDEVMKLLLNDRGHELPISERTLSEAAFNTDKGSYILQLLFDHVGESLPITEEVVFSAVARSNMDFLTVLFDGRPTQIPISDRTVSCAISKHYYKVLSLLLDYRGHFQMNSEMATKIARSQDSLLVLQMFMDRGIHMLVNEEVLITAADWGSTNLLKFLLGLNIKLPVTEKLICRAAKMTRHGHTDFMDLILDIKGVEVPVPFQAVLGAAADARNPDMALRLLHEMKDDPPVSKDVIEKRLKDGDFLEDLWEDDDPVNDFQDFIVDDGC